MPDNYVLLHNPRCRKSREGLQFLEKNKVEFEIRKYLDDKLSGAEILGILAKLHIAPLALMRKNESVYKELIRGKNLENRELIELMVKYPKLIERPILISETKAAIGRPVENFNALLK